MSLQLVRRAHSEETMKRLMRLPTQLMFALTTVVSACSARWPASGSGELAGSRWRLDGWSASSLQPSDFTITAAFTVREIGGTAAVNQYDGSYVAQDGAFSTRDLSTTQLAGAEPAMRAEGIYMRLLRDARKYKRTADRLTLMDANGNDLLYFTPVK
jgi:heat shock protein HslJ